MVKDHEYSHELMSYLISLLENHWKLSKNDFISELYLSKQNPTLEELNIVKETMESFGYTSRYMGADGGNICLVFWEPVVRR